MRRDSDPQNGPHLQYNHRTLDNGVCHRQSCRQAPVGERTCCLRRKSEIYKVISLRCRRQHRFWQRWLVGNSFFIGYMTRIDPHFWPGSEPLFNPTIFCCEKCNETNDPRNFPDSDAMRVDTLRVAPIILVVRPGFLFWSTHPYPRVGTKWACCGSTRFGQPEGADSHHT